MANLVLRRIELSNIRTFTHVVFEPESEGVTTVLGSNGSGKTSLLSSVAWVLYGTKPEGVSKHLALYRSDAQWGQDKCYGIVDIDVNGASYRIVRKMVTKSGGLECLVYQKDASGWASEPIAGPSVTHATSYIQKLVGMDEKGFLTATLVQQKQVDQLVTESSAKRATVLEKLTGLSAVNSALASAKDYALSIKRSLAGFSYTEADLDQAILDKDSSHVALIDSEEVLQNCQEKLSQIESELLIHERSFTEEKSTYESWKKLSLELDSLKDRYDQLSDELMTAISDSQAKRKKVPLEARSLNIPSLQEKYSMKSKELYDLKSALSVLEEEYQRNSGLIVESSISSDECEHKIIELKDTLKNKLEILAEKNTTRNILLGEMNQTKNALETLQSTNGTCPTCLQKVRNLLEVEKSMNQTIHEIIEKGKKVRSEVDSTSVDIERIQNEIQETLELSEKLVQSSISKEWCQTYPQKRDELLKKIASSEISVSHASEILDSAKNVDLLLSQYKEAKERVKTLNEQVSHIQSRIHEIEGEVSALGDVPTERHIRKQEKKLSELKESHTDARVRSAQAEGEKQLCEERYSHASERVSFLDEQLTANRQASHDLEVAETSLQAITEFKQNRVETVIPLLEGYASELLSRFTDGKFAQVKLSTKFDAHVVLSDGTQRDVNTLSGGEMSATSIALRIAVSQVMNAGSPSLIILDEVLVSQDSSRVELILSTIKDVCKGQVIIIGHNDVIESISDHTVNVNSLKTA